MARLYFAGAVVSEGQEALLTSSGVRWRLLSFADAHTWGREAFEYWTSPRAPTPFFLDSGAYSAFTCGAEIDLMRYCEFISTHASRLAGYASLDVIGDWRASAVHYDLMRAKGLDPIPTFHMGSPMHELRRLLIETDYIALGGLVGATRARLQGWLDDCFCLVHDFWPRRVHLFGLSAQWALERYPFYSADSSAALVGAGMGRVAVFEESRLVAMPWRDYARVTYDGMVMDGISPLRIRSGSAHRGRTVRNVAAFLALERHVSELWARKGVVWS